MSSSAVSFFEFLLPWMVALGIYSVPAGLTFGAAKTYFKRYGEEVDDSVSIFWTAVVCGIFFWISVPWYITSRAVGTLDPEVRTANKVAQAERLAEIRTREAEAQVRAVKAELEEEFARRQLERANGADIPYTREEELDIAERQSKAISEALKKQTALESSADRTYRLNRGY